MKNTKLNMSNDEKKALRCKIDNEIMAALIEREFHESNIEIKQYKYEKIDMCLTGSSKSKTMTYDIEIKSRNNTIKEYKDCTIECLKYDAIMDEKYTNERKIYAVIYYLDNQICVWNLNELSEKEMTKKDYNMNCKHYSGDKKKELKPNFNLQFNTCKKFDFDCSNFPYKETLITN